MHSPILGSFVSHATQLQCLLMYMFPACAAVTAFPAYMRESCKSSSQVKWFSTSIEQYFKGPEFDTDLDIFHCVRDKSIMKYYLYHKYIIQQDCVLMQAVSSFAAVTGLRVLFPEWTFFTMLFLHFSSNVINPTLRINQLLNIFKRNFSGEY